MTETRERPAQNGLEIAVIGMAGRFPAANNLAEFWENLKNGKETISFFSEDELTAAGIDANIASNPNYIKAKGVLEEIEYFDSAFFNYTPKEARMMDPQVRLFHQCAWQALEDAGYDPAAYPGLIGLYAGYTPNISWRIENLLQGGTISEQFEAGNLDSHFFSTLICYKLNLKGPGITLNTACSTALVGIHMACRALLTGESDIVMAGGVTITLPWKSGYIYQAGMINSSDGHCRAFAARANGIVGGNGIGIVVLKRLVKAEADRDHIYAVIKGTAINNDGSRKPGYAAPSVEAQVEVIRSALRMAELEPHSITYIETHGTGTPLGDPIEIEALKKVFNRPAGLPTHKKHTCVLGSVKTNIGHLDAAAGAAGFIKTVLVLTHRFITPTLHFEIPNPEIDFENTPFIVNTALKEWKNDGYLLRAGVSSFGIGGTNAHVILEEAPAETRDKEGTRGLAPLLNAETLRKYHLILLSAQTQSALAKMTENLAEYFKNTPEINLADAAYTLQIGRKAFNYRRMLVCAHSHEAVQALSAPGPGKTRDHFSKEIDRQVVFMFPGLGSQYVNMGLDLYKTEPIFREQIDRCLEILKPIMGCDLKEILYPDDSAGRGGYPYPPNPVNSPLERGAPEGRGVFNINQTEIAQPLVFAFEYALVRLIEKWGIKPQAMIGYSFGEYTAACVSGVFSLEHALKLVAVRGRLLQDIPAGAMLSVPLPQEKLKPLLGSQLTTAIDNGSSCIISGTNQAIAAFEKQMKEKRLICIRLNVTHAVHSMMMDSILEKFEQEVSRLTLNPPQIPYISNVTGKWITVEDVVNPRYWVDHMRKTVQFAPGLQELTKIDKALFVEVGPGVVISTLVLQYIDKKSGKDQVVVNLVKSQDQKVSDVDYLAGKIGRLWLHGKKIDWNGYYKEKKRNRVSLPGYSFDREKYPVEITGIQGLLKRLQPGAKPGVVLSTRTPKESLAYETRRDQQETPYAAPGNKVEQLLVEIWQEILGKKPIGIHDNFFELGADSIKGITFVNKFQELIGEIIHITVIFDAPTAAELAAYFKRHYPESYNRLMETSSEDETGQEEEEVTAEKLKRVLSLIPSLPAPGKTGEPKNPPAVFILSPPRTGSTLLRVMLAGHPLLFAPPELNLLFYDTLTDRKDSLSGAAATHLQGTLRAIMQIKNCSAAEAQEIMQQYENQGMTVQQFYRQLQKWLRDRNQLLVDKSPGYTINRGILNRAEAYFRNPLYIHLERHPYGMIRSYIEARMDLLIGQQITEGLSCTRRQLAEMTWTISVGNILAFLKEIPAERYICIKFEDLAAQPETIARDICRFLHLEYHPGMLQPYREKKQRMTDGVYSEGIMLGDMKFHQHQAINPEVAETWKKQYTVDFLGQPTLEIAKTLGYKTIRELKKESETGIIPVLERTRAGYPLSFAQERLWFLEQLEELGATYNVWMPLRLKGMLREDKLRESIEEIVRRHEVLRTTFSLKDGQPVQVIAGALSVPLPVQDLSSISPAEQPGYILKMALEEVEQPFDLEKGPLLRTKLLRMSQEDHVLLLTMHHIVTDAWSMKVFIQEMTTIYDAYTKSKPSPLPGLPIQYADFAAWQRQRLTGEVLETGINYWKRQMAGASPVLELPLDHPRPALQTFRGSTMGFDIGTSITRPIRQLARETNATMFMALLASFALLLSRYSSKQDIVIGTPAANREHKELEPLIGFFLNMLPIRINLSGSPTVIDLITRVRQEALQAYAHQDIPFEKLVEELKPERNLGVNPLFQVMFSYQEMEFTGIQNPGLAVTAFEIERSTAKFDLSLFLVKTDQGLKGNLEYNADLFDRHTIINLASHFKTLLQQIAAEPGQRTRQLSMLTKAQQDQLLKDWNNTRQEYPQNKTIPQLIEEQAGKTPDHIALVGGTLRADIHAVPVQSVQPVQLSYREIHEQSDRLAYTLLEKGVRPDTIVGVLMNRSAEMMIVLLAILKAGGAYMPIDPAYPWERIDYMLKDSGAEILLKNNDFTPEAFNNGPKGTSSHLYLSPAPATPLAYVIYTSGSTGTPKGVMIGHRNVVNFIIGLTTAIEFKTGKTILALTTIAFDIFVLETFLPLVQGVKVVMADESQQKEPGLLTGLVVKNRVDMLQVTPSRLRLLVESREGRQCLARIKELMVGGEAFPPKLFNRLQEVYAGKIYNLYGPTETTVWSTLKDLTQEEKITIGKPTANTRVYIIQGHGNGAFGVLQPAGIPGELCIGGDGLARGYLNNPELTAEKFCLRRPGGRFLKKLPPWTPRKNFLFEGTRGLAPLLLRVPDNRIYRSHRSYRYYIYKTGDLARWLPDGDLEYLGRIDQQAKIRGHRIEPGEIESQLLKKENIQDTVAAIKEQKNGEKFLCAYIVSAGEINVLDLREYLSARLPDYMIPSYFERLEKIPLTPNGKVDYHALPAPGTTRTPKIHVPPGNDMEKKLQKVWSGVLGIEPSHIGIDDNFFEMGLDSIKAIQVSAIMIEGGLKLELRDIFSHPTIRRLAGRITPTLHRANQGTVKGDVPLTPIQQWFFENYSRHPHHYNMAEMLYQQEGYSQKILGKVFSKLLEHHDALRMVFELNRQEREGRETITVLQENKGIEEKLFHLEVFDFTKPCNNEYNDIADRILKEADKIQGSINLQTGPLVKLGLFKTPKGDHLLIVIHHLVMDGISWRILLEDFALGYLQALQGEPVVLPEKTDSFRYWSHQLTQYAQSKEILKEIKYWKSIDETSLKTLPRDNIVPGEKKTIKYNETLGMELEPKQTGALLNEVNRAYNTEINDILLTALGLAMKDWAGMENIAVTLESHGRPDIMDSIDITRTLGWFTARYPAVLDMSRSSDLASTIKQVKETLRKIPNKGIGYGILRYLTPPPKKQGITFKLEPGIYFNYFDQSGSGNKNNTGTAVNPGLTNHVALEFNGMVSEGTFILSITYSQFEFEKTHIQELLDLYKSYLTRIIHHCCTKDKNELTPSDLVDDEDLSIEELEEIREYANINIDE